MAVVVRLLDPPESGRWQQEAADGLASASHGHARPWPWPAAASSNRSSSSGSAMPMASARGRERARGGARGEEEMGAWTAKKSKEEPSGVHIVSREAEARGSSTQQW